MIALILLAAMQNILPKHVWPMAALCLFCSLFYILPQAGLHRNLFYGVLAVMAYAVPRETWRELLRQRVLWVAAIYVAYQAISLGWSDNFSGQELAEVLRKGLLSLLFMASVALVLQENKLEMLRFWQALIVVASVSAAFALCSHYLSGGLTERMTGVGRSLNPVQGGCLYGFALVGAAWLGVEDKSGRNIWIACWAILFAALLATVSRGALLASFAAHIFLLARYRPHWVSVLWIPASLAMAALLWIFPELLQRADSFRFMIWQEAWREMAQSPFFGLGYRTPFSVTLPYGETIFHPHSIYVTALYYGGVTGLFLLMGWMALCFRNAAVSPLAQALILNAAVIGLVDFNLLLVNGQIEWLLFWLPFALAIHNNRA